MIEGRGPPEVRVWAPWCHFVNHGAGEGTKARNFGRWRQSQRAGDGSGGLAQKWEDTMQKWYEWLERRKKEDGKRQESLHQHKVTQMIMSAEGRAGLLHKSTKSTAWRGGAQILKKEEEGARLLDRCEAKRKEWAKHWQCNESVQNLEDKPWGN